MNVCNTRLTQEYDWRTMMTRLTKWIPALLAVAGFALAGMPREAHATLAISFAITPDGGPTVYGYAVDNNVPGGYVAPGGYTQFFDADASTSGRLELTTVSLFGGNYVVSTSVQTQTIATSVGMDNIITTGAAQVINNTGGKVTRRRHRSAPPITRDRPLWPHPQGR